MKEKLKKQKNSLVTAAKMALAKSGVLPERKRVILDNDCRGAIVVLEMTTGHLFYGKITEITEDTISLIEQKLIRYKLSIIEPNTTIDIPTKHVLYRKYVAKSYYATYNELRKTLSVHKVLDGEKLVLNHFDENGFHTG